MQITSGNLTVYMNDMAVHMRREEGETEDDHIKRHRRIVSKMLETLGNNDLYLNIDKCEFEQPHIDFLGVHIENNQLKMEEGKVKKVKNWLPPRNLKEVRRFLGFTGYYRYFIKGYSAIAKPLLELTRQATPWHWDPLQQNAFETLKAKMCKKPVLQQPDFIKNVLPPNGCLSVRCGSHTLTRGRNAQLTYPKTQTPPHRIFFGHLHPH
jgi:hypothetical protein